MMSQPPSNHTPTLSHIDAGGAKMVDVGDKAVTARRAVAGATVRVGLELARQIEERRGRKGDVLAVAQLAGIQAVKQTANAIPLCHPLPIDGVEIKAELHSDRVEITAAVRTTGKTGVEMEALHAASVTALTVIDMGKSVQRDLAVERVQLLEKSGGRSGHYVASDVPATATPTNVWPAFTASVLTVSDRAAAGVYEDRSGPAVVAWLREHAGVEAARTAVVPDDPATLEQTLRGWCEPNEREPDVPGLLLTAGGTGLSPRDHTPDVTAALLHRPHPGLPEFARQTTAALCPTACLSRGVAGVRHRTLILNLPGSPRGATQWLDALAGVLPHALETLAEPDTAPPPIDPNAKA